MPQAASPVGRAIAAAAIALGALLLAAPLLEAAIAGEDGRFGIVLGLVLAELAVLGAGAHPLILYPDAIARPATRLRWQHAAWLGLLCLPWSFLIVVASDAAYFGFALYFLAVWLLPPVTGSLVAVALAALTAAGQGVHHGWSNGAIIGPISAAALLIAVVLGFRALIAESSARAELIEELERTRGQLAETERRAGVEEERVRLGRELHDTVAQHLSSIQLLLQAAEHEPGERASSARIGQARDAAAEALGETRRVISDLSPAPLAEAALPVALARLAEQASARGRVRASFRMEGAARRLPMPVEATLLRIAQEAVANVERHSGATACELVLALEPGAATLEVADDGRGFDPDPALARAAEAAPGGASGYGIAGMRARAAELGGNAAIVAAPGEGTLVSVRIPLEQEPA